MKVKLNVNPMMKLKFNKLIFYTLILLAAFCFSVHAESSIDITSECTISSDKLNISRICDGNLATHSSSSEATITVESVLPIGGIYIKYNKIPVEGTLDGTTAIAKNGFLHEYISVNGSASVSLHYPEVDICDIQVFSEGEPDKSVQLWQVGEAQTDILLCATHSDDDQLFFAGLLPYYTSREGVNVRVAYFINHFDTYNRTHELLDGLWHCGVTNYPDISPFPDGYSESVAGATDFLARYGFTYDDILNFQKDLLNKYEPQVAVLHDFNGEYGHGAHMLNTKSFVDAFEGGDCFVPKKVYVHLYKENPITLNFDEPSDLFGGKSAFNVSQDAFSFHKSQHWTWFYGWIYGKNQAITKATQISSYNPCEYGLYYSAVGEDVDKNDLLENIETYSQKAERIRQEELLRHQQEAETIKQKSENNTDDSNVTNEVSDNSNSTELGSDSFGIYIFIIIIAAILAISVTVIHKSSRNKRRK